MFWHFNRYPISALAQDNEKKLAEMRLTYSMKTNDCIIYSWCSLGNTETRGSSCKSTVGAGIKDKWPWV